MRHAVAWYNRERPGLGRELVLAVEETLATIVEMPFAFRTCYRDMRCARAARRFPYMIFYVVRVEVIGVIAIIHGHRESESWLSRRDALGDAAEDDFGSPPATGSGPDTDGEAR